MTTVIVLAAGTGTRFAAAYPKELHAVRPGIAVIDPLMGALERWALPDVKVLVVVSAAKGALLGHLARYRCDTAFVLQKQPEGGVAAALLSAAPWCDETVLICLGDQVFLTDPVAALGEAVARIETVTPVTVVAASTHDAERLRREGALTVTDAIVTRAAEKPSDTAGFNACWSALAVHASMLDVLANDLAQGFPECFIGAPVVWGPDFVNVNTPADAVSWEPRGDGK